MEDIVKDLVTLASGWTLALEVENDVDVDGKSALRMHAKPADGTADNKLDFFLLMPEEGRVCVLVPADLSIDKLRETYAPKFEEFSWSGLPDNVNALCMNAEEFDLNDLLCREFLQHMIGNRANQLGIELHSSLSGNPGGCGGM